MRVCMGVCMCILVYVCGGMYIMCTYVFEYRRVCLVAYHSDTDPLARSGLDSDSCSPWNRYTDDSKTDPWDDLKIPTGSCSEIIRRFGFKIVSFYVSVCSYIFLYLLLHVDVSAFVCIISYDCMINFISMITCISL